MSTQPMQSAALNDITAEAARLPTNAPLAAYASPSTALGTEPTDASSAYAGTLAAMQPDVSATPLDVSISASVTSAEPAKKGKGVGKRLTDRQRVEILDLLEKSSGSLSNAEIARRYGITRAAIQKLKQKGAEVRARYRYGSTDTRDGRKRGGHVLSVPFERELFEWVRGLKARKVPVPPSLVKEKAKLLVPKYGLGSFQASNGWYYNFCKRFNLSTGVLVEEKAPALAETATMGDDTPSLGPDQTQLQQMAMNALEPQTYGQHFQQYQQHMAAIAAEPLQQQQSATQRSQSKSDRMIHLLEQQNAMLERQTRMIEDQATAIKKLIAVVAKTDTTL